MNTLRASLLVCAALAGCVDLEAPYCDAEVGAQGGAIIDGESSASRRSTVLVDMRERYCSGNVIGPRTVMTAEHCGRGLDPEGFRVVVVGDATYHVIETETHPFADLRLLYVDADLPEPYLALPPAEPVCVPTLRAQGYGITEEEVRMRLHERADVFETGHDFDLIYTTTAPCFGDSGSALVATSPTGEEFALGVSSKVLDGRDCIGARTRRRSRQTNGASAAWTNIVNLRDWIEERLQ